MFFEAFGLDSTSTLLAVKLAPFEFFAVLKLESSDEERSSSATGRIGFLAGLFSTKDSVLLSDSELLSLKALAFFDSLRCHF